MTFGNTCYGRPNDWNAHKWTVHKTCPSVSETRFLRCVCVYYILVRLLFICLINAHESVFLLLLTQFLLYHRRVDAPDAINAAKIVGKLQPTPTSQSHETWRTNLQVSSTSEEVSRLSGIVDTIFIFYMIILLYVYSIVIIICTLGNGDLTDASWWRWGVMVKRTWNITRPGVSDLWVVRQPAPAYVFIAILGGNKRSHWESNIQIVYYWQSVMVFIQLIVS